MEELTNKGVDLSDVPGPLTPSGGGTWKTYGHSVSISNEGIEREGYTLNAAGFPVPKAHPFSLRVWLRNAWAVVHVMACRYSWLFRWF